AYNRYSSNVSFFFQAEDGIRDRTVTGVQTCALPISAQFVAEARIAEAQQRLLVPRNSIESVAQSLGFRSADVFSVAFERFTGIRPRIYRALRRAPKSNGSSNVEPHKTGARGRSTVLRAA